MIDIVPYCMRGLENARELSDRILLSYSRFIEIRQSLQLQMLTGRGAG
jgi:hypothetical protein